MSAHPSARDWRARFTLVPAVYVFLVRDGRILLLRRQNTGFQDGKLSVIAGHMDGDEEVRAAAIREAFEEAGVAIALEDVQVVGVMHRRTGESGHERVDFFLAAQRWSGEVQNREPAKCAELVWCDLDGLPDDVIPYVRRAIENYRRGVWFDSWGWDDATAPM